MHSNFGKWFLSFWVCWGSK